MRARLLVALGIGVALVAGCAAVIDLGDEAKLRPTVDASTPVVDAGPEAGPPDAAAAVGVCGLPDSANADCAACIQQSCCDISKSCAADPTCVAGLQCVKDCLVQVDCIANCETQYPSVANETNCSALKCSKCTPGAQCSKLGACVFDLPDASLIREVEEARILQLDEDECKSARGQVAGEQSDAAACYGN